MVLDIESFQPTKNNLKRIDRSYFGDQGCACGCIGNYYSDTRTIKRHLTMAYKIVHGGEWGYAKGEAKLLHALYITPDWISIEFGNENSTKIKTLTFYFKETTP